MPVEQGREPCHIVWMDQVASGTHLLQGRVHIQGIPQDYRIDDEAQCSELILLAFAIPLPEFATLPMKHRPCNTMAALAAIQLGQNTPSILLIINVR